MIENKCRHYSVTKHGKTIYCNECGQSFNDKEFEDWDKQPIEHIIITIQ